MPYADLDFFIALSKEKDHLKESATKINSSYKGDIVSSVITIAEALLIAKAKKLDPEILVGSIFKLSEVEGITIEEAMTAAHFVKEDLLNPFDSLHAVLSRNKEIISSDKRYGNLGFKTIVLESKYK